MPSSFIEPPWMVAQVDQLIAKLKHHITVPIEELNADSIMLFLTEPVEDSTPAEIEKWEQTCDHCGKYAPDSVTPGQVGRQLGKMQVIITFGLCPGCVARLRS